MTGTIELKLLESNENTHMVELVLHAPVLDSESDSDVDMSSNDLADSSMTIVKSAAKDLSNTCLDSPEVQRQFSVRPVSCGGPVPTRALEVRGMAPVLQHVRTC